MVGALLCVVTAEGPILDLSNAAHQRGASTISVSQPPDDTPYGLEAIGVAALAIGATVIVVAPVVAIPSGAASRPQAA